MVRHVPKGWGPTRGHRHPHRTRVHSCPRGVGKSGQRLGGRHRRAPGRVPPPPHRPGGLRPVPPQTVTPPDKARHKATEPAWRLLHAVALLHIYKARNRVHMAHHAKHGRTTPSAPHLSTYSEPSSKESPNAYRSGPLGSRDRSGPLGTARDRSGDRSGPRRQLRNRHRGQQVPGVAEALPWFPGTGNRPAVPLDPLASTHSAAEQTRTDERRTAGRTRAHASDMRSRTLIPYPYLYPYP